MNYHIDIYSEKTKREWDEFVGLAVNSHFLFYRDYMEYHADRFHDYSLVIRKKPNGQILAVLPACSDGDVLFSHLGLTFGGFLYKSDMSTITMLEILDDVREFLKEHDFKELYIKAIPHIYRQGLAEEDLYALFRNNAELYRVDVCSALDYRAPAAKSRIFKRNAKKGLESGLSLREMTDYRAFMDIVAECLRNKYDTKPTHTAEELEYLSSKFPKNIELLGAFLGDELVAGAIIYKHNWVATLQYAFASEKGKELGSLQYLVDELISRYDGDFKYFVYGISTEDNGRYLNENLIRTKEYSGCRAVAYQFFKLVI
ncbi:GNAT family N-acetyltransferase [Thalassospira profundimaris]|uniref:Uncharacterized protein n=1 Tax=Thalassospira profundimaris TaxID=502049 RepID=A0A367WLI7_9PROT|nr:GNAT family N-acetyltransferase [Thalassospira profundimaris]RCK42089.1 hypothetical protein TH30_21265 [Thalassospira profundimaris]